MGMSDVLYEAIRQIRDYQESRRCYDDIRPQIDEVVRAMKTLQMFLDMSPDLTDEQKWEAARKFVLIPEGDVEAVKQWRADTFFGGDASKDPVPVSSWSAWD